MNEGIVRLHLITRNARLFDSRKAMGFTAPAFAAALGISTDRLRHIETLKKVPTEDEICCIAIALEKMPEYLFPDKLLSAIQAGVFVKRTVELESPQLEQLTGIRQSLLLTDGGLDQVEEKVDTEFVRANIEKVFRTLAPREVKVLKLRFGWDGGNGLTLEEVAKILDVTRERIRQIEGKALRQLRHPSRSRFLEGKSILEPQLKAKREEEGPPRKQTICDVCGKYVRINKGQHILRDHPEYPIRVSTVNEYWRTYILYHCGLCDFRNPSPAYIVKHINENHPEVLC